MSDVSSTSSPRGSITLDEHRKGPVYNEDPNALVERRVVDLIDALSNCLIEVTKEKQPTNKKMDELANHVKKALTDIERNLNCQLDLMSDALYANDFQTVRVLNEFITDTHQDMDYATHHMFKDFATINVEEAKPPLHVDDDRPSARRPKRVGKIPKPVGTVPVEKEGVGILRKRRQSQSAKNAADKEVRFLPTVHKRVTAENPDFEDIESAAGPVVDEEAAAVEAHVEKRLSEDIHRLLGPQPAIVPTTDRIRELEGLIRKQKTQYSTAKAFYDEARKKDIAPELKDEMRQRVRSLKAVLRELIAEQRRHLVEDLNLDEAGVIEWRKQQARQRQQAKKRDTLGKKIVESLDAAEGKSRDTADYGRFQRVVSLAEEDAEEEDDEAKSSSSEAEAEDPAEGAEAEEPDSPSDRAEIPSPKPPEQQPPSSGSYAKMM